MASLWLLCPVTIHRVSLKWLKVHNPAQTKDRVRTAVVDRLLHLWIFTYYSKISAEEAPHHGVQIVSPARVFGFSHVGLNGKQCRRLAHLFGGWLCLLYLSLSLSLPHPHAAPDQHSREKIEKTAQKHSDNELPSVKQMQQVLSHCQCFSELDGHFLFFSLLTVNDKTMSRQAGRWNMHALHRMFRYLLLWCFTWFN